MALQVNPAAQPAASRAAHYPGEDPRVAARVTHLARAAGQTEAAWLNSFLLAHLPPLR